MKAFRTALLIALVGTTVAAAPAQPIYPTVQAEDVSAPPETLVLWDGHSPMVEGFTYVMPECWPLSAKGNSGVGCLVSVTSEVVGRNVESTTSGNGSAAPATTDQITCGVNVKNSLGTIVAKLWEVITITWYDYTWSEVGASRGTWVLNSSYSWTNVWGPTPSSGTFTYFSMQTVRVGGTVKYLGATWHDYTVTLRVIGNQNWSCSSVRNW